MNREPATLAYAAMVEKYRASGQDPQRRADAYLACVGDFVFRSRQGEHVESPELDGVTRQGLVALLSQYSAKAHPGPHIRAEELRRSVTHSESPASIPPETIDGITDFWMERLRIECLSLHLRISDKKTQNILPLCGDLQDLRGAWKAAFSLLPCPRAVSLQVRAISKRLFLDGSPLFGWWNPHSDAEELATRSEGRDSLEHQDLDWDRAPKAVQQWDIEAIQQLWPVEEGGADAIEGNMAALLPFTAHLSPRQKRAVQTLFPSGVELPENMAAESEGVRATAHFPFTITVPKTVRLVLRSRGLDKGIWNIEAQLEEVLSRAQTQGKALDRLTVRDPRTYQHIASAVSADMKTRARWEIGVPLRALSGIWLVEKLPDPRQQEAVLSELLSKVPDDLFLWVLGEMGNREPGNR